MSDESRSDADEIERLRARIAKLKKRVDLWDPFGNDGMRHMESADVTGGATDMEETDD